MAELLNGPVNRGSHRILNAVAKLVAGSLPLATVDRLLGSPRMSPKKAVRILARIDPGVFERLSERKALDVFRRAYRLVPAYLTFLSARGVTEEDVRDGKEFSDSVPAANKENYILAFPPAARCVGGTIPADGLIEESSGTSGTPTNWIRSLDEDTAHAPLRRIIMAYMYRLGCGDPVILLNGFTLGAWAGGQSFGRALRGFGLLKNIGTDAPKILRTMKDMGPGFRYLLSGYPPFLKELIDLGGRETGFHWREYAVDIMAGGEGFTEAWRENISARLRPGARVYSVYGAIDIDAGIAMENDVCVAIRKLLEKDVGLRVSLLGEERKPCFLGQYSPVKFHATSRPNADRVRELHFTGLNRHAVSPTVMYNIGDEGDVIPFLRMMSVLKRHGYDLRGLGPADGGQPVVGFPFLFLFGRSDGTVSINGANIYTADVAAAILDDPALAAAITSFQLSIDIDESSDLRLCIALELGEGVASNEMLREKARRVILENILRSAECFRRAYEADPVATAPVFSFHPHETGMFKDSRSGPKYRYLKRT